MKMRNGEVLSLTPDETRRATSLTIEARLRSDVTLDPQVRLWHPVGTATTGSDWIDLIQGAYVHLTADIAVMLRRRSPTLMALDVVAHGYVISMATASRRDRLALGRVHPAFLVPRQSALAIRHRRLTAAGPWSLATP